MLPRGENNLQLGVAPECKVADNWRMIERLAYSPRDLAARWQCSERHIRNLINRGELPYFRTRWKAGKDHS